MEQNKTSLTKTVGALLVFIGMFFSALIAVFYFQANIAISNRDFAALIIIVQVEIAGLILLVPNKK